MARLINGINGPVQGLVGTVVGSSWKGKPYLKARPVRLKPATEKESANRQKFAKAHEWLKHLLGYVRQGFKNYNDRLEGFNAAKSDLLKNAFEEKDGELVINPAKVKVSAGDLPLPTNIAVTKAAVNELHFNWDFAGISETNWYDQAMVLAYDVDKGMALFQPIGQFRKNGTHVMTMNPAFPAGTYHCYIAFIAADRSRQSDSVYLGTVVVE